SQGPRGRIPCLGRFGGQGGQDRAGFTRADPELRHQSVPRGNRADLRGQPARPWDQILYRDRVRAFAHRGGHLAPPPTGSVSGLPAPRARSACSSSSPVRYSRPAWVWAGFSRAETPASVRAAAVSPSTTVCVAPAGSWGSAGWAGSVSAASGAAA